jgi:hypothetical protein
MISELSKKTKKKRIGDLGSNLISVIPSTYYFKKILDKDDFELEVVFLKDDFHGKNHL